jgi:hypothetical protein
MKTKQTARLTLIAGAALVATACFKHSVVVGAGGDTESEPAYKKWESHWFYGIIGEPEVNVSEICPSGNATIKNEQSFLNGLIGGAIGVVWHPTTVTVYCGAADAPAAAGGAEEKEDSEAAVGEVQIRLSAEEVRRIASDPRTLAWAESVSPSQAAALKAALSERSGSGPRIQVASVGNNAEL